MKKYLIISAGILVCFCMLVFFGISGSNAQEDALSAAPKVLSIPGPAFEMPTSNTQYENWGVLHLIKGYGYVRAPLVLPNATKITKVGLICKDNSSSLNIRMWIHVFSNDLKKSFTIAYVESQGAENTFRTFTTATINPNVVDNLKYFYFLNVSLPGSGSDYELAGAKVWYTGTW